MRKINKRDIAILGSFMVVVVVACGFMIARQVGGSGSSLEAKGEQILLSGRPEVDLTAVLAPQRGLTTTGEIADPRVFQEDPVGFIAAVGAMQAASDAGAGPMSGGGPSAGPQGPGGGPMGPDPAMGPMGDPVADMVQGEGEVSVYIAGLAGPSGDLAALIVHKDTGRTLWVSTGQQAFGYSVSMVTNKGAVLQRNGHQFILELGQGRADAKPSTPSRSRPTAAPEQAAEEAPAEEPSDAKSEEDKLVGAWSASVQGMNISVNFRRGGSGTMNVGQMPQPMDFRWRVVSPGTLRMEVSFGGMENADNATYRFENDGRVLILSSGSMPGELRLTR